MSQSIEVLKYQCFIAVSVCLCNRVFVIRVSCICVSCICVSCNCVSVYLVSVYLVSVYLVSVYPCIRVSYQSILSNGSQVHVPALL